MKHANRDALSHFSRVGPVFTQLDKSECDDGRPVRVEPIAPIFRPKTGGKITEKSITAMSAYFSTLVSKKL